MPAPRPINARAALIDAAADLFAAKGYAGTSTGDIARAAGVTQPLVHHHFGSKRALWSAVAGEVFSALDEVLRSTLVREASASEPDRLRALLRAYVMFCGERPQLARMARIEGSGSEVYEELQSRWLDRFVAFFREHIEGAMGTGSLCALPAAHLFFVVVGSASEIFVQSNLARRTFGLDVSDPAVIERHATVVVEVIFQGLMAR